MNFFDEIKTCSTTDRCWGHRAPIAYGPVVIPCVAKHPKVMIITEQPNLRRQSVSHSWNPSEEMVDYLRKEKQGSSGIAKKIDTMLGGGLFSDFDEQKGRFSEFYWTHFIKCPGQIRRKKEFGSGPLLKEACADKWLLTEIKSLRPRVIISFGAPASTWILSKANYGKKWTEWIWEEFKQIITGQDISEVSVDGLKAKLIVALHPSGANPLALSFNEKIGDLARVSLDLT